MDLTPESFRSQVLSGQDHWVLDFYAPWCGPCQHFAPEFEVLARVSHPFLLLKISIASDYSSVVAPDQEEATDRLNQTLPAAIGCDMKHSLTHFHCMSHFNVFEALS